MVGDDRPGWRVGGGCGGDGGIAFRLTATYIWPG